MSDDMYAQLKTTVTMNSGDEDVYGWAMEWLFVIAHTLDHRGASIPADWGYRDSILCDGIDSEDSWETEMISHYPDDALLRMGKIIDRYITWVKLAGKDY